MNFDIIIIGSGLAGYTLVKEFRRLDKTTSILLISADDGRYYSKPMLSTGFAKNKSADELTMKSVVEMVEGFDMTIFHSTSVNAVDKAAKTLTVDNRPETLHYQQLVFATGAAPTEIPLPDALNSRCFPINDLEDYHRFRQQLQTDARKNVTIIGAGLVGTEYANDLADAGVNITVVALDDRPLQLLLPQPLSAAVQAALAQKNVDFNFNASIADAELSSDSDKLHITLSTGKTFTTDLVLSAVGLKPRIALAEQAGVAVNRGIVVNQSLRTNDQSIYALGDCAEINGHVLMYVAPLTVSAKALAKTLSGTPTEVKIPASPVIVKTPACPVVSCTAQHGETGEWIFEGEAPDLKATFIAEDQSLLGFALTGKKVMERMKLAKQLPAIV